MTGAGHRVDFHDAISPAQARVLFHAERLIGTAGRGRLHRAFTDACRAFNLPAQVTAFRQSDCVLALQILEAVCRARLIHLFRDTHTGWRDFT